jgi:uncharacterized protein (UPF0261 family)
VKASKTIVIVGTLDTKGEEIKYLKELIEKRGHKTIVFDAGVMGEPMLEPDIRRSEVAEAAGTTLKEVVAFRNWKKATETMANGAKVVAGRLHSEGKLDGIIGIGGTMGTTLCAVVTRGLPLFLPKVIISTLTFSPFFRPEVVGKDIVMMPTMVELAGGITNETIKTVIENAAGAICGMVEVYRRKPASKRLSVGITSFGFPAIKVDEWARPLLQQKGYDVSVFPGAGSAYEEAVDGGLVSGSLDLMAGAQLINEISGGINLPSPRRFEAGKENGIPQVFVPGIMELFSCRPPVESLPPTLKSRKTGQRSAFIIAVKTSNEEMAKAGEIMAQELNQMTGPTAMVIPSRGFSEWDKPDAPPDFNFYDPGGRSAFIKAFKAHVRPHVKVLELDLHINDPAFAREAVVVFDSLLSARKD